MCIRSFCWAMFHGALSFLGHIYICILVLRGIASFCKAQVYICILPFCRAVLYILCVCVCASLLFLSSSRTWFFMRVPHPCLVQGVAS